MAGRHRDIEGLGRQVPQGVGLEREVLGHRDPPMAMNRWSSRAMPAASSSFMYATRGTGTRCRRRNRPSLLLNQLTEHEVGALRLVVVNESPQNLARVEITCRLPKSANFVAFDDLGVPEVNKPRRPKPYGEPGDRPDWLGSAALLGGLPSGLRRQHPSSVDVGSDGDELGVIFRVGDMRPHETITTKAAHLVCLAAEPPLDVVVDWSATSTHPRRHRRLTATTQPLSHRPRTTPAAAPPSDAATAARTTEPTPHPTPPTPHTTTRVLTCGRPQPNRR